MTEINGRLKAIRELKESIDEGIDMEELYIVLHSLANESDDFNEYARTITFADLFGRKRKNAKRQNKDEIIRVSNLIIDHVSCFDSGQSKSTILRGVRVNHRITTKLLDIAWKKAKTRLRMTGIKRHAVYSPL